MYTYMYGWFEKLEILACDPFPLPSKKSEGEMYTGYEISVSKLLFLFSVRGKSEFPLPPSLGTALEYGHFDHLEDSLLCEHYRQRLHMLLHIEEFERRRQMTRFDNHFQTTLLHVHVLPA